MTITINNKEITIKNSFRAMMVFERLQEGAEKAGGLTTIIQYFWCCIIATKEGSDIDYDTFLDWLDDNQDKFKEFSEWITKQNNLVPKKN